MSGTPMMSFGEALTVGQRWDVAAYILSLREVKPETGTDKPSRTKQKTPS